MKTTDPPIELEFRYGASMEQVWSALTVHSEMIQWYFEKIPSFEARVGFTTEFPVSSEERTFTHHWKVTELIPKEKIIYNWSYKEYTGNSDLILELVEGTNETIVHLKVVIRESFIDGIPEFKRENCIGGWNYFLGGNLAAYLAKTT